MPLSDQIRISRDLTAPRILALWHAMQPLRNVMSFLQIGAHPDDETTAMLAALGLRDGYSLAYACANRGEGGQNDLGTESHAALGVLRTAEMERACDVLNMRLYWLSETPDDSIFDFGFSKSGEETLGKWGTSRTLDRMVQIIRAERPDIMCTTFLDVPGQHGHHRAMTQTAIAAFDAAADPAFAGSDAPVWEISRLFVPAWSGAGGSYDDEVPPPPATTVVSADGYDTVSGWDWARIGQQSRGFHKTQGMGRWIPPGHDQADWPLHCVASRVSGDTLSDGLPTGFADLGCAPRLDDMMAAVFQAFPEFDAVLKAATAALANLRDARQSMSAAALERDHHRFDRAENALAHVIRYASGTQAEARAASDWLRPGETTTVDTSSISRMADVSVELVVPDDWSLSANSLTATPNAGPTDAYPACYDPASPRLPALDVTVTALGVPATSRIAMEVPPKILPARTVSVSPDRIAINRAQGQNSAEIAVTQTYPATGSVSARPPKGWSISENSGSFAINVGTSEPGLFEIPVNVDGQAAWRTQTIGYDHVDIRALSTKASLKVRVIDVALPPNVRVGYVGGGNDRVSYWLREIGVDCTDISDAELAQTDWAAAYDTIIIGIFALRFRDGLAAHIPYLHEWTEAGGNLVTLYHRPWDNWDPDATAPRPLEIGKPSLRFRVTDENARVNVLHPDHALLTTPNTISEEDWHGWHKERGLYFAKSWDDTYTPLLEMSDPGETPHRGSLLSAEIGKGKHTHCALILHHQMEHLVPGAFRLMANLIAPR